MAEDAARDTQDQRALARVLNQRGLLAMEQTVLSTSRSYLSESFEISQNLSDKPRALASLINLGTVNWLLSDFTQARARWETGLGLAREIGHRRYEAYIVEISAFSRASRGITMKRKGCSNRV